MRAPNVVAIALVLVLASMSGLARASELIWEGAPACPERGQLLFELEQALGKPLSEAGELAFHVYVESSKARASARLHARRSERADAADERVLVARSCAELIDMLAVAISLAIGSFEGQTEADTSVSGRARRTEGPDVARVASVGESPAEVDASTAAAGGPRTRALTLMVADIGSLPRPALGAGLGVELGWSRLRVQLSAAMFYPQRVEWASGSGVSADLALTTATIRACTPALSDPSSSLSIPLCLGWELGRLDGEGRGVSGARSRGILWIAPRAEVGLSWAVPGTLFSFETSLGAAMPLNRDEFVFDGMGAVHQPSRVVGRLESSLNLRFE